MVKMVEKLGRLRLLGLSLLLVLPLLFQEIQGDQCTDTFGSSAQCMDEALCVSSDSVQYGVASGLCPGAANIKCCTNFLMTNSFKFYNPSTAPWQKDALDTLQGRLTWFQEFRTFSCKYRNKTPDGTYCGGEDGMNEIKLSNTAFYFTEQAHQIDALNYIQNVMMSPNLIEDWLTFVKEFRNLLGGGGGAGVLPPAPDTSGSQGSCQSPFNGFQGSCISVSECTGATFNGLCPGSSKCCSAETRPANPKKEHLSLSSFKRLYENISTKRAEAFHPYFNEAMDQILKDNPSSFTRCHRIAAFVAQTAHESLGLLYFEEIASGSAYNGRCSGLGNCQPNDGPRFKGRGPIQLTGRYNYRNAGQSLNMDFESRPEQVCFPSAGFKAATWFWNANNLNRYCTGNYNDFTGLSVRINGGYNGISDRRSRWATAKSLLGCPAAMEDSSYVLGLAGLQGNETLEEDREMFASEFCPQNYQGDLEEGGGGGGVSNVVVIATVVPCTVLIVLVIAGAAFYVVKKREGNRV